MFNKDKSIAIALDEEDFLCLVRGGVLTIKGSQEIQLLLSDIGFDRMHNAIEKVESGREKAYEPRCRDR